MFYQRKIQFQIVQFHIYFIFQTKKSVFHTYVLSVVFPPRFNCWFPPNPENPAVPPRGAPNPVKPPGLLSALLPPKRPPPVFKVRPVDTGAPKPAGLFPNKPPVLVAIKI